VIAYRLRQARLDKLEKGKHIGNHRTEFGRNFVQTYDSSSAFLRQCRQSPSMASHDPRTARRKAQVQLRTDDGCKNETLIQSLTFELITGGDKGDLLSSRAFCLSDFGTSEQIVKTK